MQSCAVSLVEAEHLELRVMRMMRVMKSFFPYSLPTLARFALWMDSLPRERCWLRAKKNTKRVSNASKAPESPSSVPRGSIFHAITLLSLVREEMLALPTSTASNARGIGSLRFSARSSIVVARLRSRSLRFACFSFPNSPSRSCRKRSISLPKTALGICRSSPLKY